MPVLDEGHEHGATFPPGSGDLAGDLAAIVPIIVTHHIVGDGGCCTLDGVGIIEIDGESGADCLGGQYGHKQAREDGHGALGTSQGPHDGRNMLNAKQRWRRREEKRRTSGESKMNE